MISDNSTSLALTGALWVESPAQVRDLYRPSGSGRFAISAFNEMYRSSSSNGAASTRRRPGEPLTGVPGIRCLCRERGMDRKVSVARLYKDGDDWATSDSFGRDDLPLLAKLADLDRPWIFTQTQNGLSQSEPDGQDKPGNRAGSRRQCVVFMQNVGELRRSTFLHSIRHPSALQKRCSPDQNRAFTIQQQPIE